MKKRLGFKDSKAFPQIAKMPPLYHTLPDQEFDIMKSPAVKWICLQPVVLNYLFSKASSSGAIIFDPETKMWRGGDWREEEE